MRVSVSTLEKNFESIVKIGQTASKLGIFIGIICIVWYCLRIDYFPQDVSLGEGLLFLIAAACFGVLYVFFVSSLVALGISLSPVTRGIVLVVVWLAEILGKKKLKPQHELAPFDWLSLVFSLFAVLLIIALGHRDPSAYWNLPLLSLGLYLFYSAYRSFGEKIKKIETINNSPIHSEDKGMVSSLGEPAKLREGQLITLGIILVMPLAVGGVSGQLIDSAMRGAHIRIENARIYVKEPYSSLIPASLSTAQSQTPKDYASFTNIKVLLRGAGKRTVVSFQDGKAVRKLEIPNEDIIVESQ